MNANDFPGRNPRRTPPKQCILALYQTWRRRKSRPSCREPHMEIILIVPLIVLAGVFAMAEIALVSVRKPRLQQWADQGTRAHRWHSILRTSRKHSSRPFRWE